MATLAERKVAAIVAASCADAAAQPIHWIYNQSSLDALLHGKKEIEFRDPSANPFYRIDTGKNTCYGDQAFVLLESLVAKKGLNTTDLVERYYKRFGPGSEYEVKGSGTPISSPWKNGCIKEFLKNVENKEAETGSATDKQIDGVTKLAPIVALYAGREDCMEKVEDAIRVTQNEDFTVAITIVAARILEQAILHGKEKSLREIAEDVLARLSDPRNPNRHELDTKMAALLRETLKATVHSHMKATQTVFVKS